MKKSAALAVVITLLLTLAACATPYGKYGIAGGYTDKRIDGNTFSISVDANGYTDQQTTSMHAMYRAAELTVENAFDYFVIASGAANSTGMAMVIPGSSTSYGHISGNTATVRTYSTPTTVVPVVFPNSSLIIKTFKGAKPTQLANAYDARELMRYLGPQIGVSSNSADGKAADKGNPDAKSRLAALQRK